MLSRAASMPTDDERERAMQGGPAGIGTLFFNIGVFAAVTFLIYLACMALVRHEDRRQARRRGEHV